MDLGQGGGGEGGEDRGCLGPPSTPLPLVPPRTPKKGTWGRGVEGGVITAPPSESRTGRRRSNLPPPPTRPHPRHGQVALNVRALDGSGKGVGFAGGSIVHIIIREHRRGGQAPNLTCFVGGFPSFFSEMFTGKRLAILCPLFHALCKHKTLAIFFGWAGACFSETFLAEMLPQFFQDKFSGNRNCTFLPRLSPAISVEKLVAISVSNFVYPQGEMLPNFFFSLHLLEKMGPVLITKKGDVLPEFFQENFLEKLGANSCSPLYKQPNFFWKIICKELVQFWYRERGKCCPNSSRKIFGPKKDAILFTDKEEMLSFFFPQKLPEKSGCDFFLTFLYKTGRNAANFFRCAIYLPRRGKCCPNSSRKILGNAAQFFPRTFIRENWLQFLLPFIYQAGRNAGHFLRGTLLLPRRGKCCPNSSGKFFWQ